MCQVDQQSAATTTPRASFSIVDVVGVYRQRKLQDFTEPELLNASMVNGGMKRLSPSMLVKNLHKREEPGSTPGLPGRRGCGILCGFKC